MKSRRRFPWIFPTTVLACALAGGLVGGHVEATAGPPEDSDVQACLKQFTQIYELVEQNYADRVDPDSAIFDNPDTGGGAIPGMLRQLDPHSLFFDPKAFSKLREDQEGRYSGVGMVIAPREERDGKMDIIVLQPMPNSPALKAGLKPGDVVIRVDGKSTEGMGTDEVATLLKGPRGTTVHIMVTRETKPAPLTFDVVRHEIPHPSVDAAFLIRPGIGYIHITEFSETTGEELHQALADLNSKDLHGLILDLRDNPGGVLKAAVEVSGNFLQKNQLIVYHAGRNSREERYVAPVGEEGNQYPMVVLINRMTASAAEIVSGALQDHDRALLMGEPSFGKGLVQSVYTLSEHTGLALTTAHYYTPSGRLIQRNYSGVSLYDYYLHYQESAAPAHPEIRRTDAGREVFGGGGITPDVTFHDPPGTPVQFVLRDRREAFLGFGLEYLRAHGGSVPSDFVADDTVLAEFRKYLTTQDIPLSNEEFNANQDFIRGNIRAQLLDMVYGQAEGDKARKEIDPIVQKALEEMPQARDLLARLHRATPGPKGPGL